ncbi:hypothetical protein STAFG_1702 [Streptomyces afghaniensis 772]|uniref:Uncharacterized protein n=1 Tax=Streptomyces afghaniensis 772 TaxID=1283301 RepID=S4NS04_9ACTN|nr:hypothetical protein STAFG_1702 [Streptomyces afghaniensis 772]
MVRDRLVQLLREGVHREQRCRTAAVLEARRVDVVDDALDQLRDGPEAGRAVAGGVRERHVRAVVGAVDVAAVPAALELEGAHHVAALRAQRVLVLQLPVLEARAAPGGVGVGRAVDERLGVTGDDAQQPRHGGDLATRVPHEGQRDLLRRDDLAGVALDAAAGRVGVLLLGAVLQAQHRPVVGGLVARVDAARLGVREVLVAGEGVVGLVSDVVVEVVGAVGDARGGDDVVGVEQAVLVHAAVGDEGAPGGFRPLAGSAGVGLDAGDGREVGGDGAVARLSAVAALTALALAVTLLLAVLPLLLAGLLVAVAVLVFALRGGLVAGVPYRAGGEGVEPFGAVPHPVDGDRDALEGRGPLVLQRVHDRAVGEAGVLPHLLCGLAQALVGLGDLLVQEGQFLVDLPPGLLRDRRQFAADVRAVDRRARGPDPRTGPRLGGVTARTAVGRGGVDVRGHQAASAEDQCECGEGRASWAGRASSRVASQGCSPALVAYRA